MSQPVNSYNVLIDRFAAFAAGHYLIGDFTHGQLDLIDIPKDKVYPWMHVFPAQITQQPGQATYDWQVWFMDLPRDKEDAGENIRECISDCIRLAQDLIYEVDNGNVLFGRDVDLVDGATITPEIREFTHTLTGVQLAFSIVVPDDYDACAIPADYAVGAGPGSTTPGVGSLTFAESLVNNDGVVTLVNDEDAPGNSKYYGTNAQGMKGWYTLPGGGGAVDSVNGQTGDVVLDASDVGADPAGSAAQALSDANDYTDTAVSGLQPSGNYITELTGDVTATGPGSVAATIADNAVTYAKMQDIPHNHLIGRHTNGSGDPQSINIDGGLELNGANIRRAALTGDVTASAGSNTTTIANDAVTYAKMQNVSNASRLLGRGSAGGAGDVQELTISSRLTLSGTALSADSQVSDTAYGAGWDGQADIAPSQNAVYDKIEAMIASYPVNIISSTNTTTSSTTPVDVTDVTFPVDANSTYRVVVMLRVGCSGTGGMQFGWTFPSDATLARTRIGTNAATISIRHYATGAATGGSIIDSLAFNAVGDSIGRYKEEIIVKTTTAGTMQMQIKSNTNGQTSTVYSDNTLLIYQKI